MIYHYVKKGRLPSEIYNLPEGEKAFLFACMWKEQEAREREKDLLTINRITS